MLSSSVIKILIIDDDEDDFFIIRDLMTDIREYNFKIDWCYQYTEALHHVCGSEYDLYFIDYRLGAKTGLDFLHEAIKNHCEEPMILLTGKGNREIDTLAMQAGAVDYLVKGELNVEKLERCIRYSLERAASMKALRLNEKKYRNIFESSQDAIFVTDEHFFFKNVNKAASTLFEYSTEELLSMRITDLFVDEKEKNIFIQSIESLTEIRDLEVQLITKNQETKPCIISISKYSENIDQHYLQGIIHDITSLKKAEKMAHEAQKQEAIERLVRMIAHEVRNPLSNINLSMEVLQEKDGDQKNTELLNIISRNANRINDLISELLNFSRTSDMFRQKVILQDIIRETIEAANDRIILKKINIKLSIEEEPFYIEGDKEKLKIAFLNIIINAIEAMEFEKGELQVNGVKKNQEFILTFTDNGIGIPQENIPRLFEQYFTSKKNGMGLGLSSTFNILRLHNGSIAVRSAPGIGTSFIVTIRSS